MNFRVEAWNIFLPRKKLLNKQKTDKPRLLFLLWAGKDSNLRRRKPTDLQSVPVDRFGTDPKLNFIWSMDTVSRISTKIKGLHLEK